jgi:hypothetical protein
MAAASRMNPAVSGVIELSNSSGLLSRPSRHRLHEELTTSSFIEG